MGRGDPTALIGAYEPGPAEGGLRGLLLLAGAPLVEHQARRAIKAGASRVLLLVEELPVALADAIARLRQEGVTVRLIESIDAAAEALSPGEPVLLFADGCLPDDAILRDLTLAPIPALATLADTPDHARHERIDADARWAGVALLDGSRVADAAAMVGSWDPISTLLRRAVQEGAHRISADEDPPLLTLEASDLATAESLLIKSARRPARDWVTRWLFRPIEELALPVLIQRRVEAWALGAAGSVLALLGGLVALAGWRWPALTALLASGPLAAGAARLARVQTRPLWRPHLLALLRELGAVLVVMGIAGTLAAASGQWAWWLMGIVLLGVMAALGVERRVVPRPHPAWIASADMLGWAMLPFALVGRWDIGLVALLLYATASFATLQRRILGDGAS